MGVDRVETQSVEPERESGQRIVGPPSHPVLDLQRTQTTAPWLMTELEAIPVGLSVYKRILDSNGQYFRPDRSIALYSSGETFDDDLKGNVPLQLIATVIQAKLYFLERAKIHATGFHAQNPNRAGYFDQMVAAWEEPAWKPKPHPQARKRR